MFNAFSGYPRANLTAANIVVDGNSLTADAPSWANYLIGLEPFASNGSTLTNVAVSGQTTAAMITDATTQVDPLYNSSKTNILIAFEIINDLYFGASVATAKANLQTYCTGRRTAGFKVVVIGILPTQRSDQSSTLEATLARHDEIRAWLAANWKGFADAYLDPKTLPEFAAYSSSYFYDQVHLNDTGDQVLAAAVAQALKRLSK